MLTVKPVLLDAAVRYAVRSDEAIARMVGEEVIRLAAALPDEERDTILDAVLMAAEDFEIPPDDTDCWRRVLACLTPEDSPLRVRFAKAVA